MRNLCPECQKKTHDMTIRGSCQAPTITPSGSLPQGHFPWTASPNFSLCEACSEHFGRCAACWGSLDGGVNVTVPTDKQFCIVFDGDNGRHVKGMLVGEQMMAKLVLDLFSGQSWAVKKLSPGVKLATSRLVSDGSQYGWLECYFDLTTPDPQAFIELKEVATRAWAASSSKTWRVTFEVKR